MKKTIDSMFRNCTQQEREAIEDWPVFSDEEVTELNDLFGHYIFYQWETKETMRVWTSCCHRQATVHRISRVQTAAEYDLITTRHNGYLQCPFCKRAVQKKHINRIGKGLNLKEWRKAVVVHNREDGVYLTALHVQKEYNPERRSSFTALPEVKLASAYRFRPGEVMQVIDEYYGLYTVSYEIRKMGKRKEVQEPFHGAGYYGIGLRRLRESWMKYCQYDTYEGIQYSWAQRELNNLVDYLTVYSIYPKQVEMLVKMGMGQIVYRMEEERVKSSRIFDWDAKDIKAAFRVDGQELRAMMKAPGETAIQALETRATCRELGEQRNLVWLLQEQQEELLELHDEKGYRAIKAYCRRVGLQLTKVWRYLMKFTGPLCHGAWFGITAAWDIWKDTIDMADQLGYDIRHETIALPKELELKHNEYATAINEARALERKKQKEEFRRKTKEGLEKRKARYEFEADGLRVIMPMTMEDVQAEGRALQHCVGGYAQRHVEGTTTILFLRKAEDPETPYVTIEIKGTTIQQVHGFKNERDMGKRIAPPPEQTHKKFLDLWLKWVKDGSKRDEDGRPVLPGRKDRKEKIA